MRQRKGKPDATAAPGRDGLGNATGNVVNTVVVKSNETGNGTNVSNNNTTLTNVSLNVNP